MGWFNRDKVNSITPFANTSAHRPRVGAKVDTHTVRDDSGNTTQAMTQRRAERDAAGSAGGPPPIPGQERRPIKIGAEYTTYHEPGSPEGKAILKDKKKTAKALKKVNDPKVMAESKAAGQSFNVAKEQETKRMNRNKTNGFTEGQPGYVKPSRSEKAFLEGGVKGEREFRNEENIMRTEMANKKS